MVKYDVCVAFAKYNIRRKPNFKTIFSKKSLTLQRKTQVKQHKSIAYLNAKVSIYFGRNV